MTNPVRASLIFTGRQGEGFTARDTGGQLHVADGKARPQVERHAEVVHSAVRPGAFADVIHRSANLW